MTPPIRVLLVAAVWTLTAVEPQSVLFPHGYFDMRRLKAKDAIYLNLLALSALEHGGITIDELDALAQSRQAEPRGGTPPDKNFKHDEHQQEELQSSTSVIPESFTIAPHVTTTSVQPIPTGATPKSPFRRLHDLAGIADDVDNPFEEIATRAPAGQGQGRLRGPLHTRSFSSIVPKASQRESRGDLSKAQNRSPFPQGGLQQSQLLGIYHPKTTASFLISDEDDLPTPSPRKRPLFTNINLKTPTVLALPVPPPLNF